MTVKEFKVIVQDRSGVPADQQRLIFAGKELEEKKTLSSYTESIGLDKGATMYMVLRLPGGMEPWPFNELERSVKVGVPRHTEVCLVCYMSDKSVKMPCGHPICPGCLMSYAWSEVSYNGKVEFHCPLCNAEWSLKEIQRYGNAREREITLLQEGLSENAIRNDTSVWECPGCDNYCCRKDTSKNVVFCRICSNMGKTSTYCCHCLQEWKKKGSDTICGNDNCNAGNVTAILQQAPLVSPQYLPGDIKTPSKRACVECGVIIELVGHCKHMTCRLCKTDFCFVCLRRKIDGFWMCRNYSTPCTPAPVQQRIPVRKAK